VAFVVTEILRPTSVCVCIAVRGAPELQLTYQLINNNVCVLKLALNYWFMIAAAGYRTEITENEVAILSDARDLKQGNHDTSKASLGPVHDRQAHSGTDGCRSPSSW